MSNFKFIKAKKAYNTLYFQFPKVLMYGEKYSHLTDSAKIAYMLLLDRMEISIRNNWIDEDQNVFFNYTVKNLMKLLHCGNQKVNYIKHELEEAGLLFQKQMGVNIPNRLYLADLEVGSQDIYSLGDDNVPSQPAESFDASPEPEMPTDDDAPKYDRQYADQDVLSQNSQLSDATNPYTDKLQDELLRHLPETLNNEYSTTIFNNEGLKLVGMWCNTVSQAKTFIGKVLKAKHAAEKKYNETIVVEYSDYQEQITQTLRRFIAALKDDRKTIRNTDGYLYTTFKHTFSEICEKEIALQDRKA